MQPLKIQLSSSQKLGAYLLLLLLLFALLPPLFGYNFGMQQQLENPFGSPSWQHPLGSDQFGRDMLSRLSSAIRLSFFLSIICVLSSAFIGTTLGVIAAWAGKHYDSALNFIANTIMSLPGLVLVLLFAAISPGSFLLLYIGISMTLWVEYFRVVRASVKPLIHSPALQASTMLGFGNWYLFRRHIWPNIRTQVFTLASFGAATSVLMMASTGFVYVGLKPPTAELGLIIVELFPYFAQAPWLLLQPLIVLFIMVLGFNLLAGDKQCNS